MKIRIRFMINEIVNNWPQDAPEFDEKQVEIIYESCSLLKIGDKVPISNSLLEITKIITSNATRIDGITAFAQAKQL